MLMSRTSFFPLLSRAQHTQEGSHICGLHVGEDGLGLLTKLEKCPMLLEVIFPEENNYECVVVYPC